MTFVSALFSRTHFNANYFAVLNESFKVISLFSYQSSLFVVFATAFTFYQKHLSLSTTFFLLPEVFSGSAVASHAACVLTFLLSVPPHQRQLAYNSTAAGRSQHISIGFAEVGHLALFPLIVRIVLIIRTILLHTTCT